MTLDQAVIEASRCLMCHSAPCEKACPAGVGVTTFIRRLRFADFGAALRKIIEANVLAGTCGMACPKGMLCEEACVLAAVGRPILIRDLQLSAHLYGFEGLRTGGPRPGTAKAAILGGGPAGIACAYYLKQLGVAVSLFERAGSLGGMLTGGIPEYRITKEVALKEIGFATEGVGVATGVGLEKLTLPGLRKQGFGAAYLATGLWEPSVPEVEGRDLQGVFDGSRLLAELAAGKGVLPAKGSRVAVIGGGNTACDAALSLRRCGSSDVTVFYRRTRAEMPAFAHELNDALIDGVKFEFLAVPVAIKGRGKVEELVLRRTQLGEPDASGRRRPVPVEGSEFEVKCDCVVFAAGGAAPAAWLRSAFGLEVGAAGRVQVSPETYATGVEGVFAGGDLVREKGLVVEAVGDGRRAAFAIAKYLGEQS